VVDNGVENDGIVVGTGADMVVLAGGASVADAGIGSAGGKVGPQPVTVMAASASRVISRSLDGVLVMARERDRGCERGKSFLAVVWWLADPSPDLTNRAGAGRFWSRYASSESQGGAEAGEGEQSGGGEPGATDVDPSCFVPDLLGERGV
jgi:hypothetical protein